MGYYHKSGEIFTALIMLAASLHYAEALNHASETEYNSVDEPDSRLLDFVHESHFLYVFVEFSELLFLFDFFKITVA